MTGKTTNIFGRKALRRICRNSFWRRYIVGIFIGNLEKLKKLEKLKPFAEIYVFIGNLEKLKKLEKLKPFADIHVFSGKVETLKKYGS